MVQTIPLTQNRTAEGAWLLSECESVNIYEAV
jgi:hypothetical protein